MNKLLHLKAIIKGTVLTPNKRIYAIKYIAQILSCAILSYFTPWSQKQGKVQSWTKWQHARTLTTPKAHYSGRHVILVHMHICNHADTTYVYYMQGFLRIITHNHPHLQNTGCDIYTTWNYSCSCIRELNTPHCAFVLAVRRRHAWIFKDLKTRRSVNIERWVVVWAVQDPSRHKEEGQEPRTHKHAHKHTHMHATENKQKKHVYNCPWVLLM